MRSHRPLPVLVVLVAMLVVSSCSSSGRDAAEPERVARTRGTVRTPVTAGPGPSAPKFVVHTYSSEALGDLERWLGRRVDGAQETLDRHSWEALADPSDALRLWEEPARADLGTYLNVPMLTERESTLSRCAAGEYDRHFTRLASRLVAAGHADAVLRLGHEPNGHWFPWSAVDDPDGYIGCWRTVVDAMRGVPGASFRFDWSVAFGPQDMPAARAYPGDEYVDVIGMDVYDLDWEHVPDQADDWYVRRWEKLRSMPFGLDWLVAFAAEHDKPISLGEWGLTSIESRPQDAGGDNPHFVEMMHAWIEEHRPLYHAYFERDVDDGDHRLLGPWFPVAAERFRELFGS